MISRRDFLQLAAATAALAAGRLDARLRPAATDAGRSAVGSKPVGNVTLVHLTDIHAQLLPVLFREPSINLGVGDARGQVPHLTGRDFLDLYKIPAGSRAAYALTSEDFAALAKSYGRLGGLDRIATVLKAIRAERGDRTLFLDGGDTWQNSYTSLVSKGQDMVDCMALLKPDAMTGHWEFTLGTERVKELVGTARLSLPRPERARHRMGRAGLRGHADGRARRRQDRRHRPGAALHRDRQSALDDPELVVRHPRERSARPTSRRRARRARSSWCCCRTTASTSIASSPAACTGIDVILTAHTHDALPDVVKVGKTLLVASGSHGKFLSRLDLDVRDGEVKDYRFKLIPIFADVIAPDAEMAAKIAAVRAPHEKMLGETIGRTETLLYRRGNFNGTLDDVICDALLAERDAEIALSPGFRWGNSLLPGQDITREDIYNATALTYPAAYRTTMTGARLKEVLEDVADNLFNPDPYYQQGGDMVRVGGVSYTIDVSQNDRPADQRSYLAADRQAARGGQGLRRVAAGPA